MNYTIEELEKVSLRMKDIKKLKRLSTGYFAHIILHDIIYFEKLNLRYSFDDLIAIAVDTYGMNKGYYWESTDDIIWTAMDYYIPFSETIKPFDVSHLINKKYYTKKIRSILLKSGYEPRMVKNSRMIKDILELSGYSIIKKNGVFFLTIK